MSDTSDLSHPSDLPSATRSRREFLATAGGGIGVLALAALAADQLPAAPASAAAGQPFVPRPAHFPARAKRVIWLFMHGGPSHVDLFDPKPELVKLAGHPLPDSFGPVMTRRKVAQNPLLGPIKPFRPCGGVAARWGIAIALPQPPPA
jgi:hypothetical protein